MKDMEAIITIKEKRETEQFVRKQMRQEISKIETDMEETVQMYGQLSCARAGQVNG